MPKLKKEIIEEINNYIAGEGSGYDKWYVGITAKPRTRLFTDHNVAEKSYWIYRGAEDSDTAREIEEFFLDKGMAGDTGGGDDSAVFVYAYKITPDTVE